MKRASLLLTVLFVAAIVVNGQEKGPKAQTNKQNTNNQHSPTQPITAVNQQAAATEKEKTKEHSESYLDRLFSPENLPNVGLFVVGLIGVIVAICTLIDIKKQTENATITANAAKKSAEAMMDADRAWVLIIWDNTVHIDPDVPNGVLHHCFRWTLENYGKSPAFIEKVSSRFIVIEKLSDLPPEPIYLKPKEISYESEPLLPDKRFEPAVYSPIESDRSYEDLASAHRNKKCILYAYGFVSYRDVYRREHTTRFGLVYEPGPNVSLNRFRIAGPETYNRYE